MKCEFKLVFNNIQYCPYVTSEIYSKKQCVIGINF